MRKDKTKGIILDLSGLECSWAGEMVSFNVLSTILGLIIRALDHSLEEKEEDFDTVRMCCCAQPVSPFPERVMLSVRDRVLHSSRGVCMEDPFPQGWHIPLNVLVSRILTKIKLWRCDFFCSFFIK